MKNWFVSVEQKTKSGKVSERTKKRNEAKGIDSKKNKGTLKNAVNYLLSKKHKSHEYSIITDLENARLTEVNILDSYDEMREKHSKGTKNIASSFVLSMPADLYHPSVDEWREIKDLTLKKFVENINEDLERKQAKHLKKDKSKITSERKLKEYDLDTERFKQRLTLEDVEKLSTAVIHDEREKPLIVGTTTGSHLNILMSNIFNGEVIKNISQLGGVLSMKNAYSEAVKEKLGLDCDLYIPYSQRKEGEELKNFYSGETNNLELVEVNENTPHKNKIINSDNEEFGNNPTKPHWVIKQEKAILLQKGKEKLFNQKDQILGEIKDQREELQNEKDQNQNWHLELSIKENNLEEEEKKIIEQEKNILEKRKKLRSEKKVFDKLKEIFVNAQSSFKDWMKSLHSDQKELEKLAVASADAILELEQEQPAKAKSLTVMAENEEKRASLFTELEEDTKVTAQVKKRRNNGGRLRI